ncbi:class I SAM-dependent methyltransferase [Pedosphaera parvula]|uniref:Methyltransferase type 12 n=1 Tax=Pedosphaera parvula (strain Ellin514) TaxID=320771 RepID=B9XDS5_PEDPL|nr:class I SAM-dependent methyltransferase [Pedosphaera parvula]EEF62221.1 Methyltransferase type 12 [Pedosphaera parvula Ellin514]
MSFDLLAPHYRWMEFILAGGKLQRSRTAHLKSIREPKRALLLGEGNGRFLVELLSMHSQARVTCLDASQRMLDCARSRIVKHGMDGGSVEFIHADILEWLPGSQKFDLIVTNFFLDCFTPQQIEMVVEKLAGAATPEAQWLLADFREPPAGMRKLRAKLILQSMYLFFRAVTRLPASRLTPPDSYLRRHRFELVQRSQADWGLLHSDLWNRSGLC